MFEKVCAFDNLLKAAGRAMQGKLDAPAAARFHFNLEKEVIDLQRVLLAGAYRPRPYRCFYIHEPKRRYICAADFRDRVVHHALCNLLEPVFERRFIHDSYACRRGKGTHRAVRRVRAFARKRRFFLKTDIRKCFASIDHAVLKRMLRRQFKDARLLTLMDVIIDHPVPGHPPGKGLAIGNLTSQWWANFYLDALDHFVKDETGMKWYARYMDDMVLMTDDKADLHHAKARMAAFLSERLLLEFKEKGTHVAPVIQGIPFLGFRIFPGLVRLKHANRTRFIRQFREKEAAFHAGHMDEDALIRSVVSMIGHLEHADTRRFRRKLFYG